jgi:hypothetical protein
MLSSHQLSPHLPPIFSPIEPMVMEPMTPLPCAVPVHSAHAHENPTTISVPVGCATEADSARPTTAASGPTTTPGTKRPADEDAATSEAARARPTHKRLLSKPDGRCAVRSALHGSSYPLPEGISDILADDSVKARGLIREVRTQAAQALKAAMEGDETLHMVVSADFPDEAYEDVDSWAEAMASDDTEAPTSPLWHGGGQWLLYGLGLVLKCTLSVTSFHPDLVAGTGFIEMGSHEVVAAGERVVRLAMLHDDDGVPDHFDVLVEDESAAAAAAAPPLPLMVESMPRLYSSEDSENGVSPHAPAAAEPQATTRCLPCGDAPGGRVCGSRLCADAAHDDDDEVIGMC